MNLIIDSWSKKDVDNFSKYLQTLSKGNNGILFEEKIIKSNYKCIAVPSKNLDSICKQILKGNFLSFLNYMPHNNVSEIIVCGKIISKIKDFNTQIHYLNLYLNYVDSWATTDLLKFKIKGKEDLYFSHAIKLLSSDNQFMRRTGIIMLFPFKKCQKYSNDIFNLIVKLKNESEYYVNMAISWFF